MCTLIPYQAWLWSLNSISYLTAILPKGTISLSELSFLCLSSLLSTAAKYQLLCFSSPRIYPWPDFSSLVFLAMPRDRRASLEPCKLWELSPPWRVVVNMRNRDRALAKYGMLNKGRMAGIQALTIPMLLSTFTQIATSTSESIQYRQVPSSKWADKEIMEKLTFHVVIVCSIQKRDAYNTWDTDATWFNPISRTRNR